MKVPRRRSATADRRTLAPAGRTLALGSTTGNCWASTDAGETWRVAPPGADLRRPRRDLKPPRAGQSRPTGVAHRPSHHTTRKSTPDITWLPSPPPLTWYGFDRQW